MKSVCFVVLFLGLVAAQNNLFDYVNQPDPNYSYFNTNVTLDGGDWTGYLLNMTSQAWLHANATDHHIWTHQLLVIVPNNITTKTHAALYVTGGSNHNPHPPKVLDEDVLVGAVLAVQTGTVAAVLWQCPNQPIVFTNDPLQKARSEDALIAYTWRQFIETKAGDIIGYFPMVKAAVRAMDTVDDFIAKKLGNNIQAWAVAGASKRGATTWLTGAFSGGNQGKVVGIIPIVFDFLDFGKNVEHMYKAYGGWTFAFTDYLQQNITQYLNTPQMDLLATQVDMLNYKQYLKMPKMVVDSTGDEFFMPDDDWFWWGKLEGPTYRLMVQNAEHSMATGVIELLTGAIGFWEALINDTPVPEIDWTLNKNDGNLTLFTSQKPKEVILWYAETVKSTPNRRDFRLVKGDTKADPCEFVPVHIFGGACLNPIVWLGKKVEPSWVNNGTYYYTNKADPPANGNWLGYFFETKYPGVHQSDFRLTTQMAIVPNVFPFESCGTGAACDGPLV